MNATALNGRLLTTLAILVTIALVVVGMFRLPDALASQYATAATATLALVVVAVVLAALGGRLRGGQQETTYW